jgi:hypothetical protein
MNRRDLLKTSALLPLAPLALGETEEDAKKPIPARIRPHIPVNQKVGDLITYQDKVVGVVVATYNDGTVDVQLTR